MLRRHSRQLASRTRSIWDTISPKFIGTVVFRRLYLRQFNFYRNCSYAKWRQRPTKAVAYRVIILIHSVFALVDSTTIQHPFWMVTLSGADMHPGLSVDGGFIIGIWARQHLNRCSILSPGLLCIGDAFLEFSFGGHLFDSPCCRQVCTVISTSSTRGVYLNLAGFGGHFFGSQMWTDW